MDATAARFKKKPKGPKGIFSRAASVTPTPLRTGSGMGPPRGRTLHVLAFGLFRVRPFKEGTRKRLEYITQNGIMSMASRGLSQHPCYLQPSTLSPNPQHTLSFLIFRALHEHRQSLRENERPFIFRKWQNTPQRWKKTATVAVAPAERGIEGTSLTRNSPPPPGPPKVSWQWPTVGSEEDAASCERGNSVQPCLVPPHDDLTPSQPHPRHRGTVYKHAHSIQGYLDHKKTPTPLGTP